MKGFYLLPKNLLIWVTVWIIRGGFQLANGALLAKNRLRMANINVRMNYRSAEKANLSEMHHKYLNYLYNMALVQPQWRDYALNRCKQHARWVNFTENNIFGHCSTWHNDYV